MNSKDLQKPLNECVETYRRIRAKHPDAIILFRYGFDTYQAFCEDAVAVSEICHRPLRREFVNPKEPVAISCFDSKDLDIYLPKLVRAGKRVAICEDIPDPKSFTAKRSSYQPQK